MKQAQAKIFRTVLEPTGTRLHWVISRVPVDPEKGLAGMAQPVRAAHYPEERS